MTDLEGMNEIKKIEFKKDMSLNLTKKALEKLLLKFNTWKIHFINYLLSDNEDNNVL